MTGAQYLYVGFSRRNIKFRVAAHTGTISEKATGSGIRTIIRIGLKSQSVRPPMSRHLSTRKISSKSMHALSNLAEMEKLDVNLVSGSGLWSGSGSKVDHFVHVSTPVDKQNFIQIHARVLEYSNLAEIEKSGVIRFLDPDYDPDRAQNLISLSVSRHLSTSKISSKSMHVFLSNLANRQTGRQTNIAGNRIYLFLCRR